MVDTSQLRDALERTGMKPDKAAALAPELARHLATAGADVHTGEQAGRTGKVQPGQPGWEPELPFGSIRSWFRQMPYDSVGEYWEKMPAHAPWILAVLLSFITAPLVSGIHGPGSELLVLHALATHPKKIVVDRLDLRRRDRRMTLLVAAWFAGMEDGAPPKG